MALPESFSNAKDYFEECVKFMTDYSWVYAHPNTKVLTEKVFERIPETFVKYFETIGNTDLNKFPFVHEFMKLEAEDLRNFRETVNRLIPRLAYQRYSSYVDTIKVNARGQQKMSNKKRHEVTRLSERINELCCDDIDVLVDLGCGCGYLSEALHMRNSDLMILGLEAFSERVATARQRRDEQLTEEAKDVLVYQQHYIKMPESKDFINEHATLLLEQNRPPPIENITLAIIGLHACADLSITAMKLFFEMPNVKRMINMPCCYHKMEIKTENDQKVLNFPLSTVLQKAAIKQEHFTHCFHRPFLRLACQQSAARWAQTAVEEHAFHGEQMYYRALAEMLIRYEEKEEVVRIKPLKRCTDHTESLPNDFAELTEHYELHNKITHEPITWTSAHQARFYATNLTYGMVKGPRLAETLTCLQVTLQRLCENIVLFDRLCYMQECAENLNMNVNLRYEKVLNEKLSPRCFVLIAEKLD